MNNMIVLSNIEIAEYCNLDLETGKMEFLKATQALPKFMGTYFRDENTFFALYRTEAGPMIYYKGESLPLRKKLHITLKKKDPWRTFQIKEYNICIQYRKSRYIGLDVWSTEMDVDLFYQIKKSYKKDEYYESFTLSSKVTRFSEYSVSGEVTEAVMMLPL